MSQYSEFLNATYAATESPIPVFLDGCELAISDPAFFKENEGKLRVSPLTDDGVAFFFGVIEDASEDSYTECRVKPTAALFKDGTMILVWTLDRPASVAQAQPIADALGMDALDECIPLPGTDGWSLAYVDADIYCTLRDLESAYVTQSASTDMEVLGKFHDASVLTPFDPSDDRYVQEMIITVGGSAESKNWKPVVMDIATFFMRLSEHKEGKKDGPAFVVGKMVEGRRLKNAVISLSGVGLDIDTGTPLATVYAALKDLGCSAICYTTHSHNKTRTEFKKDALLKFASGEEIGDDQIKRYLISKEWDASVIESAFYVGDEHNEKGIMAIVEHAPMPKTRIIIPFAKPFVIADEGVTQQAAMERWTKVPLALAEKLNIPLDKTGTDPSRLFYFPRHAKNRPYEISIFGGDLFDWRSLELDDPLDRLAAEVSKGTSKSKTEGGRALGRWSMKAAHGFQIVDVLETYCPDRIRGKGTSGVDIECPFDENHNNPGDLDDRACFAVNAGDGTTEWFTISCRHESCRQYTLLDMLGKMVTDGWFDRSVLDDDQFNAIAPEDAPKPEVAKRIQKEDNAKRDYRQALDDLKADSSPSEIEEAIRMTIDAKLDALSVSFIHTELAKKVSSTTAVVRKLFKDVEHKMSAAEKRHTDAVVKGLDIFTFHGEFNFDDATSRCYAILKQANAKENWPMFSHINGDPVRMRANKDGRIAFDPLNPRSMWSELNMRVAFVCKNEKGEGARSAVPREVGDHVYEQCYTQLPPTPEVIYTPLYLPDNTLMLNPGWLQDHDILMPNTGFSIPPVPVNPTHEEMEIARDWLRYHLFSDFPFLDYDLQGNERREPSEANAFAMLLTPFMRRMINSCTPVFFITKPTAGTGGTLLGKLPMLLFDGIESAPMRYTQNEEEMQKALTAAIMETRSHLFFDDVREFNNRQILQSLTAQQIGGRLLGSSKNIERPNRFNWIGTGNNPDIKGEMERRICWIRMNAKTNDIQQRTYLHSDFEQFVKRERGVAVCHILTMIEYWLSTGAVPFTARKRASFEDWAEKVGGVLQACGIEGFLDNKKVVAQDADEAAVKQFVKEWLKKYQVNRMLTPAELFAWAINADWDVITGNNDDQKKSRFMKMMPILDGRTFKIDEIDYMVRSGLNADDNMAFYLMKVDHRAKEAA
jgi:hypothetical protein